MSKFNRVTFFLALIFGCLPVFAASYDATVHFAQRVTLSVPVTGQVQQVNIKAGQAVRAGDVLIALDKTPFEAAVVQAQSEVTTRETQARETGRDFDQLKELYERGVLSKVELENGELSNERARAAHEAAQAHLTQAQYNLTHSAVISPFDGWVLQVAVNNNETVNNAIEAQPLVILAEANRYIARAQVSLNALGGLEIDKPASVSIGSKSFKGKIVAIALEPLQPGKDKTVYAVDVEFNSKGTLFRVGQSAKVDM